MREIKFRAWIKRHKVMVRVVELDFERQLIYHYKFNNFEGDFEGFKDIELMQYTGLKDKYGIEIYEGDIIKDTFEKVHKIFWHGSFAGFCYEFKNELNKRDFKLLHLAYFNIEVIGNIYENPELIGDDE